MSLESDLFRYFKVDFDLLEPFGFVREEGSYLYTAPIKGGQFSAAIKVDELGNVSGRVIDNDLEEDYFLFRRSDGNAFAAEVREEYLEILKQIVLGCFKARPFMSEQGNMLQDYAYREYGDTPDNPFSDDGSSAVFRNHHNRKWYGLIMAIAEKKLKGDSDEIVEVINLKIRPENRETYLSMDNIFPAYHMNKQNWISVILDSTVSDELLTHLVDESHAFTEQGRKPDSSSSCWLVPANPQYYDVLEAFRSQKTLSWHTRKKMQPGDAVYIYYSAPYSSIVMKAQVTAVEEDFLTTMKLVEFYDKNRYPLSVLRQHGLKTVRFINRLPLTVVEYLERKE
jgi:predicted DNA-binding protein (MmcQ/YjbR family)